MSSTKPIIGLSGTNGSGKDSLGHLLASKYNFLFISVSDLLRDELKRRGLSTERQNTRDLSAEWRREYGMAVLVNRAVQAFEKIGDDYAGLVMSSLRNPHEVTRIHELGGTMVWIDADPLVRYERIQSNKREGRSADDNKTFEQFIADEQIEMERPADGDEANLNMSAVRDQADVIIVNNGSGFAELEQQVKDRLGL